MKDDYLFARQSIIPPGRQKSMDGRLPWTRCPKDMEEDLLAVAKKYNLSGSQILRHAVRRYLADIAIAESESE
jgi:hypothetical protein